VPTIPEEEGEEEDREMNNKKNREE